MAWMSVYPFFAPAFDVTADIYYMLSLRQSQSEVKSDIGCCSDFVYQWCKDLVRCIRLYL